MNADTRRSIEAIKRTGWYKQGLTLGEGGWQEVHELTYNWLTYTITFENGHTDKVTAKDDNTALRAFASLYDLNHTVYEIHEVITEYRLVHSSEQ